MAAGFGGVAGGVGGGYSGAEMLTASSAAYSPET